MSDVEDLLERAAKLRYGPARVALLDEAVVLADSLGDVALGLRAREAMTDSAGLSNEPLKGLAAFTWRLALYDREPQRFDERAQWELLWDLKKTATLLINRPDVPAHQVEQVLDDMAQRYAAYGQGARTHAMFRWEWAWQRGHAEEAERLLEPWQQLPRDDLSHCEACEPSLIAAYLAETGRHEQAIRAARPVLDGESECFDEPEETQAALALSMVRVGRPEQAASMHRRSYRAIRGRIENSDIVHHHLTFLALTGNEVRGLEVLEENLRWLVELRSPSQVLALTGAAALLLRRIVATMSADTPVRVPAGLLDAGSAVTDAGAVAASVLLEYLETTARGVVAQFDARNGTDRRSRSLVRLLESEPVTDQLPLAVTAVTTTPRATTGPAVPVAEPAGENSTPTSGDGPAAGSEESGAAGTGYELFTELDNGVLGSILDEEDLNYGVDDDGEVVVPFEDGPLIGLSVLGSEGDLLCLRAYYPRAFDDDELPRLQEFIENWHSSTFLPKLYQKRDQEGQMRLMGESVESCRGGRTRANLAYAIGGFISAALRAQNTLEGGRD